MPTQDIDSNGAGVEQEQRLSEKGFGKLLWIELAVVTIFLLALGSPYNSRVVNMILFHPEKQLFVDRDALKIFNEKYGVTVSDQDFRSKDGTWLHGWYFKKPSAKRTFLVSHGNAGNLSHRYLIFMVLFEADGSVFIYDYHGYGKSQGEPNDRNIVEDSVAAYDFMVKDLKVKPDSIVLYGESLGCAVSTSLMQSRPVQAVILQSPFINLARTAKDKIAWAKIYPDFMFEQNHLDNLVPYKTKHPPLLLIHGDKDWILNPDYSKEIYKAAVQPKQLLILEGKGHNDIYPEHAMKVVATINQFLASKNPN